MRRCRSSPCISARASSPAITACAAAPMIRASSSPGPTTASPSWAASRRRKCSRSSPKSASSVRARRSIGPNSRRWSRVSSRNSTVSRRHSSPPRGSGMMASSIPGSRDECWDFACRSAARLKSDRCGPTLSAWPACEDETAMIYSEQHRELMRSVTRFCEVEINPHVDEWERAGIFPAHEVFKKAGEQGLLGIHKPEKFGGLGLDYSYEIAFCEALGASRSGSVSMAIGVRTDMATPALARHGSDALREEFLRPSITGDYVACLGVSEVGAGSDVASIKTRARREGGDYVIDGGKMWTTNGTQADWMCLLCNTGDGPVHRNKSLICLPMKTKGVEVARKLDKLGMRASDTAQIFFDGVRVPQRYRIGEEGMGFIYQMQQFQEERLWAAAG